MGAKPEIFEKIEEGISSLKVGEISAERRELLAPPDGIHTGEGRFGRRDPADVHLPPGS